MTQIDKANRFHAMHNAASPLQLYNIWDAATAAAAVRAGSAAVATGSWSVAAAQGYDDGEKIPFDHLCLIVSRIAAVVHVPVTVDFECGYARGDGALAQNVRTLIQAGAVGINFEDQDMDHGGLIAVPAQAARISVIAAAAATTDVPLFINARTDMFLQEPDQTRHAALMDDAINRAEAYRNAGASGFFAPGLGDPALIEKLAESIQLPVNIMAASSALGAVALGDMGVSRISHGPAPFGAAITEFERAAKAALGPSG